MVSRQFLSPRAVQPLAGGLFAPSGARAATLKAIEMRIKATRGIQKITKAMKMVASAKLRAVQTRNRIAEPFTAGAVKFLSQYEELMGENESGEKQTHLYIIMTGDRGLCGSVNTNVAKAVKVLLAQGEAANEETKVICVGKKGGDVFNKFSANEMVVSYRDVGKIPMNFTQACIVAEDIVGVDFDKATIVYTKFYNAVTQTTTLMQLPSMATIEANPSTIEEYEFDTDNEYMLSIPDLVEFQLASLMHGFILETMTSTEASRVQAMENSTTNAGELIEALQLSYNKARQSKITGELIEIISGAEAV